MEAKLEGKFARLPDGQKVWVERIADGVATVRRVGGVHHRRIAVCAIAKLKPINRSEKIASQSAQ